MATAKTLPPIDAKLYDEDFYLWTQAQAEALRRLAAERWNGPLDLEHLAEEVEDLGKAERHAVRSQLIWIIEHSLKLAYSPASEPRGQWKQSINNARDEVEQRITRSIRRQLEPRLPELYGKARLNVEIDLESHKEEAAAAALPDDCPFTWDDLLRPRWYPQAPEG